MLALGEAEHLPAERVVGAHQPLDLGACRGGRRPVPPRVSRGCTRGPELAFVPDPDHDRRAVRCRGRHQAKGDDLGVLLRPDGDRTVASCSYSGVTRAAGNAGDRDSAPTHEADAAEVIRRADQRQHVLVRTLARLRARRTIPRRCAALRGRRRSPAGCSRVPRSGTARPPTPRRSASQPRWPVTRSASSEGPESSDSVLTPISSSRRRLRASPRRSSVSGGGGRLGSTHPVNNARGR